MNSIQLLSTFVILFFVGNEAYAATQRKKSKPQEKQVLVDESTDASIASETTEVGSDGSTSTDLRGRQNASAGLLLTPASDFVLNYGLYGAVQQSPSLQLGGAYIVGSKTLNLSETQNAITYTSKATLDGTLIHAYGRYFVGNSFNVSSGLGYRAATIKYSISDNAGSSISGKIDIQSIVIPFFIGNTWTWGSGFTLGCDWIGALIPISGSAKSSLSGTLDSASSQRLNDELVDMGDKLAKSTSLTLLLTSIGWAF